MLIIRDKTGVELRVARTRETQHATEIGKCATDAATGASEPARRATAALDSHMQPASATHAQLAVTQLSQRCNQGSVAEEPVHLTMGSRSTIGKTVAGSADRGTQFATPAVQALIHDARAVLYWTDDDVADWRRDLDENRNGRQPPCLSCSPLSNASANADERG